MAKKAKKQSEKQELKIEKTDILNEIERVKNLLPEFHNLYRTGIYRNRYFVYSDILHQAQSEVQKNNPDPVIINFLCEKLKLFV